MGVHASSTPAPRSRLLAAALVTGATLGGAEALRVARTTPLAWTGADVAVLGLVGTTSAATLALLGVVALLALPRVVPRGDGTGAGRRGALLGFGLVTGAAGSVAWFKDPPPHTDTWALHGHPLVWVLGVAVATLALAGTDAGLRRMSRPGVLAVAAAAVLGLLASGWAGRADDAPHTVAPPTDAPNILVVTLDTARADRFGAYGSDLDTRHFDRVAREGVRFERTLAVAPVTGPSHASMFMGAGPWDHGVLLNGVPLPERPLLAELLRGRGWRTAAFVSAYVLDGELGFRRGFEVYDDSFATFRGLDRLLVPRIVAMAGRAGSPDEVLERRGADTVESALRWLRDGPSPSERWFLWVHLFDPHGPYAPPPPWDTHYYAGDPTDPANTSLARATNVARYQRRRLDGVTDLNWVLAQYAGEVSYADTQLGRLLEAVEERGDRDRTLVAVIGDHGESLGEHGTWFNHGDDVFEESVRVPFAMRLPGTIPAGSVVQAPVEGSDLAPTLLALAGVTPPDTMTGRAALASAGRSVARALCFDREANVLDRRAGRIDSPRWRMAGATTAATHAVLRERSGEAAFDSCAGVTATTTDADRAALGSILRTLLDEKASTRSSAAELPEEDRARLEALGYLSPTGE